MSWEESCRLGSEHVPRPRGQLLLPDAFRPSRSRVSLHERASRGAGGFPATADRSRGGSSRGISRQQDLLRGTESVTCGNKTFKWKRCGRAQKALFSAQKSIVRRCQVCDAHCPPAWDSIQPGCLAFRPRRTCCVTAARPLCRTLSGYQHRTSSSPCDRSEGSWCGHRVHFSELRVPT